MTVPIRIDASTIVNVPSEALDAFIDDACDVMFHVLREPDYKPTRQKRELAASVGRREFPSPDVFTRIVEYTLFELQWRAKYRAPTDDEQRIYAAACRLSDAITGAERAAR